MGGELAGHGTKSFFHQPFSWASDLRGIGVEGASPILPSAGAPPDRAHGFVIALQFMPACIRQPVNLLAILGFRGNQPLIFELLKGSSNRFISS